MREGNRNAKLSRRCREKDVLLLFPFVLQGLSFTSFASALSFVLLSLGFTGWDSGLESLDPNIRLRKLVATLGFKPPHMDSTCPKPHQKA